MADTMITFNNAMLIGLTCLVSGMFCGAGAFAVALEIFGPDPVAVEKPRSQEAVDADFGTGTEAGVLRVL